MTKVPASPLSRRAPMRVPILTYHSLDDSGAVTSVRPADFKQHMRSLAERGFTGITLRELLSGWEGTTTLPARPVVLTFDDAYANLAVHAAPEFADHGFRATIFAVTGRCGKTNDWAHQAPGIPRVPLLGWQDLADLGRLGCEIGAHTVTHPMLTELTPGELQREILESKHHIEDKLGIPATTFAYPFGAMNDLAQQTVAENFDAGCSVQFGAAWARTPRHALPRFDVYYLRDPAIFERFGTPAGAAYLAVRGLGRRVRAALGRS